MGWSYSAGERVALAIALETKESGGEHGVSGHLAEGLRRKLVL